MEREVLNLIEQLNVSEGGVSDEAESALIARGQDVVAPVLSSLHSLTTHGQLHAIDVLLALKAVNAGYQVTELLRSQDGTVREWSANALGALSVTTAIGELREAYRAALDRGTPLNFSEPVTLRVALTTLGGRVELPTLIRPNPVSLKDGGPRIWRIENLYDVMECLFDHAQVILFVQLWQLRDERIYRAEIHGEDWTSELDFTLPWPATVKQSHDLAFQWIESLPHQKNLHASIEWINSFDV